MRCEVRSGPQRRFVVTAKDSPAGGKSMPRQVDPSWRDGIHGVGAEDFKGLRALVGTVFWEGLAGKYPHMYSLENGENLRVVVENGRVVSHVGIIERNAALFGCTVKVSSLGGVATYDTERGRGHATRLFEDAVRKCREDGVDYMLVSGYRKMYHRFGCRYVGKDWEFSLGPSDAERFDDERVEVAEATQEDVEAIADLYRREPVRWLRPPSDYVHGMTGYVMNRPATWLLVRKDGALRGYVILSMSRREPESRSASLAEFAGDREALAGALGKIVRAHELEQLGIHVLGNDAVMREQLEGRGLTARPANASGTVMIINFRQLMERVRPHFEERLGTKAAEGFVFLEKGEKMVFALGCDQVVAEDRGQAVQLIFGTLDGAEEPLLKAGDAAGEALRCVFPLPALWYGVNYV